MNVSSRWRVSPGSHRTSLWFATLSLLLVIAVANASLVDIYVSNAGANSILKIDSLGNSSVFASGSSGAAFLAEPSGIAFDSFGNLFVANSSGVPAEVVKISPAGNMSVFASTGLNNARGVAIDRSNNVYVANSGSGSILRLDANGNQAVFASGLPPVTGLAFDNNGNLLVAALTGSVGRIYRIDPSGNSTVFISGGPYLISPYGLTCDAQGNVYAANYSAGSIAKFTPQGQGSFFATGLSFPWGLASDRDGNIYSVNNGNGQPFIKVFNPQGVGQVIAASGLANPRYIAIQEVPEPTSCALTSLGIAALVAWRKRC